MSFLVLHVFADVSVARMGFEWLIRNCLPKGDFKLGFQEHPSSCCGFGWSALPSWTGLLHEGHLCREQHVFHALRVLSRSREKCRLDDSHLK